MEEPRVSCCEKHLGVMTHLLTTKLEISIYDKSEPAKLFLTNKRSMSGLNQI